ncbi:putative peptidoglycan glycosyltransferase FtsW [Sphingomonas sp.]|jgi:cell division protein FtsW|uniref:FtsW/RodA/SpoVE family cell cycle protein n=1 Tax=Sphingomonas sp. TaxID=28214 RepID=UPI002E341EFF|nr:putative peptidoglycan glycosyltransferase FtsW [Sphingomonas sp.]HEX4695858.1 putative peptidoglycan glycosyltransferase FtsW [Sphingomonas sp.]
MSRMPKDGLLQRMAQRGGRADRSALGAWFWDIDWLLLILTLFLIAIGLVAVAAASPASAHRYSDAAHHMAPLHYFWRQLMWVCVSLPVLFVVSMLPADRARRFALIGCAGFLVMLMLVPLAGVEVNGARRWLGVGIAQFQPSEFLKPCFIVAVAWLLSMKGKEGLSPLIVGLLTGALTAMIATLLMLQPDFGQTVVFCTVWFALLLISGVSARIIGLMAGAIPIGLLSAYLFYSTARTRIDAFLFPGSADPADHFQTNAARATLTAGGWLGTGPGGGQMKFRLPEAHTDYIFSVIGEEFGLIACGIIAVIFLAIVVRVFVKLLDEQDDFRLLAAAGLAIQFGAQALISMAVNTGLAPSKGMTMPFISYGGSSMIALSIGMGLLLAFTRRNPFVSRSPYVVKWSGE